MRFGFIAAAFLASTPVHAQSVGLLIGNEDYAHITDVSRADRVIRAGDDLRQAGMQIISLPDATLDEMHGALVEFGQMAAQSNTLLVVLSGRFLTSGTETYFLPVDGEAGPLATLSANALPLTPVMAWLAAKPGEAVLVLATYNSEATFGSFLKAGIGERAIPQGVTVVTGAPRPVEGFLSETLARPGRPLVGQARRLGLNVEGYAPLTLILLDAPVVTLPDQDDRRTDIRDWRSASDENTAEAYEAYLKAHPDGEFVRMAENRIQSLTDTPQARAERAEQALDLSRDVRRDIQRDLSLLGFNTRGIDGIFGRGTRAAISDWQTAQGLTATGYVTADQIARLDGQAERRAQELEAEAERRRQEQIAADLAFWDETGALGDEAGLRAYLNRYPDGEYSEVAAERLAALERDKRTQASAYDRRLWDAATGVDTIEAYEDYLRRTDQNGAFKEEALARIATLDEENRNSAQTDRAARGEEALNLSPRTRQVVEARLESLGLKPGPVDGVFDDDTRRAIRRYQSSRNMPETGYLSEAVVVQLLADSVRQIFR